MFPIKVWIEWDVVWSSRAGSWIADVGVPAKEAPPWLPGLSGLPRFTGQSSSRGEGPRWPSVYIWKDVSLQLSTFRWPPSGHAPLATLRPTRPYLSYGWRCWTMGRSSSPHGCLLFCPGSLELLLDPGCLLLLGLAESTGLFEGFAAFPCLAGPLSSLTAKIGHCCQFFFMALAGRDSHY